MQRGGGVDFEKLREILGDEVDDGPERYEFIWPGKRDAIRQSQTPSTATLRPRKDKSVDWNTTKNLYIEGDNLEVLKLLQRSYHGKVKMIYIDPPYNTGNDFVYNDKFGDAIDNYKRQTGQESQANPETDGRYHSNWCTMMYPRLRLARELLREDGVIFISIDDGENRNLRNLCDELFGERNFVNTIIWQKRYSPQNAVQWLSESHDFILVYAKNKDLWQPNLLERTEEMNARYINRDNDPRGPWKASDSYAQAGHGTKNQFYVLTAPNGKQHYLPTGMCWRYTEEAMKKLIADNRVYFGKDGNNVPAIKKFLSEVKQGVACQTIWTYTEVGHSQEGKKELKLLFPESVPFDTPKPTRLIRRMLDIATDEQSLVLDFFSGSATTADAVMQVNAADNGKRRYILVQLPERTSGEYTDLCSVGEERIRRAGQKIKAEVEESNKQLELGAEPKPVPDIGFRVLSLDSSNFEQVEQRSDVLDLRDNTVKAGRSDDDLVFEVMLKWGLDLSLPIEPLELDGYRCWSVAKGELICCMDEGLTVRVLESIASMEDRPRRVLLRDNVIDDTLKLNAEAIFGRAAADGDEIELRTV